MCINSRNIIVISIAASTDQPPLILLIVIYKNSLYVYPFFKLMSHNIVVVVANGVFHVSFDVGLLLGVA